MKPVVELKKTPETPAVVVEVKNKPDPLVEMAQESFNKLITRLETVTSRLETLAAHGPSSWCLNFALYNFISHTKYIL